MSHNRRTRIATVRVEAEHRLFFTEGVFRPGNDALAEAIGTANGRHSRIAVFVDEGLCTAAPRLLDEIQSWMDAHGVSFQQVRPPLVVKGTEAAKNDPGIVGRILNEILQCGLCRHSCLVAVGGGAMLDVVGFAAATAHRGIPLVRIPTTSLSQADSGVGVKNGVNHFGRKNWLGTFAVPRAVINDPEFLRTLPLRERRAGLVEAFKVALIRDGAFAGWIEENAAALAACDQDLLAQAIERSAILHFDHITRSGDPFERGSSRPLDFGHWAAHKLEQITGFALSHAEAVAVGMALDLLYGARIGVLAASEAERFISVIEELGFPVFHPSVETPELLDGIEEFRQHLGGALAIPLVTEAGRQINVNELRTDTVMAAVRTLRERAVR